MMHACRALVLVVLSLIIIIIHSQIVKRKHTESSLTELKTLIGGRANMLRLAAKNEKPTIFDIS